MIYLKITKIMNKYGNRMSKYERTTVIGIRATNENGAQALWQEIQRIQTMLFTLLKRN